MPITSEEERQQRQEEAKQRHRDYGRMRMRVRRKDPKYRAEQNGKDYTYKKAQREDPKYRAKETESQRDQYHRRKEAAESKAREVYAGYRQLNRGWPAMPPMGLKVAVHPNSAGLKGKRPQVVRLDRVQPSAGPSAESRVPTFIADPWMERLHKEQPSAGPSAESRVPAFIADPKLDLSSDYVRTSLTKGKMNKGKMREGQVSEGEYAVAVQLRDSFLDAVRVEEFGVDAVPSAHAPSENPAPVPVSAWASVPFVPSALADDDDDDDADMSILAAAGNMPPLAAGQLFSGGAGTYSGGAGTYSSGWGTGVAPLAAAPGAGAAGRGPFEGQGWSDGGDAHGGLGYGGDVGYGQPGADPVTGLQDLDGDAEGWETAWRAVLSARPGQAPDLNAAAPAQEFGAGLAATTDGQDLEGDPEGWETAWRAVLSARPGQAPGLNAAAPAQEFGLNAAAPAHGFGGDMAATTASFGSLSLTSGLSPDLGYGQELWTDTPLYPSF
ncbi:hypothetical protein AB0D85_45305, partial [Streptomyces sp. NPDC048277]